MHRVVNYSLSLQYATKPPSEGLAIDGAGNVFVAAVERSSIVRIAAARQLADRSLSLVSRDKKFLRWPKGLAFSADYSWLYVSSSALHHKFRGGSKDVQESAPYQIVKIKMIKK